MLSLRNLGKTSWLNASVFIEKQFFLFYGSFVKYGFIKDRMFSSKFIVYIYTLSPTSSLYQNLH